MFRVRTTVNELGMLAATAVVLRMCENRFDLQCCFSDISDDEKVDSVKDKAFNERYHQSPWYVYDRVFIISLIS